MQLAWFFYAQSRLNFKLYEKEIKSSTIFNYFYLIEKKPFQFL